METIKDAAAIILGGKPGGYYLAGFFFAILGLILSVYMHSLRRDKYSPNTPINFSWSFLLWDNAKRITVGLILMFILFRIFDLSEAPAMIGVGFFLSFGLDKAIEFLMERTNVMNWVKNDREKFPGK